MKVTKTVFVLAVTSFQSSDTAICGGWTEHVEIKILDMFNEWQSFTGPACYLRDWCGSYGFTMQFKEQIFEFDFSK